MKKKINFISIFMIAVLIFSALYLIYPIIYNFNENKRGIIYRDKEGTIIIDLDKFYQSSLKEYKR